MSSKFMSAEEFAEWAEHHTIQEVEQKVIEQEAQLREELLESSGNTFEEFQAATQQGRDQILERGGQAWIKEDEQRERQEQAEEAAADTEGQNEILSEFCRRHPNRFPSEGNAAVLTETYLAEFVEVNPGITPFWDLAALESVFSALEANGAFSVTRVYKS